MKLLTDIENENYENIPYLHEFGFSLSLLKIRNFLEKKNLLNVQDDYYTEKIFNAAKKFFNEENNIFSELLIDNFMEIFEELYEIKIQCDKDLLIYGDILPNKNKYFFINLDFSDEKKKDYLEDFYGFNNLIAENSFKFYDSFNDKISNVMDKISPKFLSVLIKITNIISNYAIHNNENNAIRENYLTKLSNYVMTFLLNERINEEKNSNNSNSQLMRNLYNNFWELLKNLLKIDQKNEIVSK